MTSRVGQQLGNYRLIRLLGSGGFAEVYLGEHLHLGSLAAIKVLSATLTGEEVEPFRQEARTIARLEHPHIVRVLDFDVQSGVPFLVMAFAPGGTLRQRHPRGSRLALPAVLDYVSQVAKALQYAHESRVIHRDIKPENLLVGRNEEILLSDFGIALLAQSSMPHGTQDVIGTAAYMAPEQFQGKPCKESDQYALGVIVYEWLTGTRPFQGSFVELASQHLSAPPPPFPGKIEVSPAVQQVVFRALAKDPRQRFGSVRAFAAELSQADHANPSTLPASGLPEISHISRAPGVPLHLPASSLPFTEPTYRAQGGRHIQVVDAGGEEPVSSPRTRGRKISKAICLGLFAISLLLWLSTFSTPPIHNWLGLSVFLSLVLWIAAYGDRRRATKRPSARAGRKIRF